MSKSQSSFSQSSLSQSLNQNPTQKTILTAYGPHLKISISFPEKGRTKQSFKDECDINNIMARYLKTGVLDYTNKREGSYGDATSLDFQSSMDLVARAKSSFSQLPAKLRARFNNNPGELLAFTEDADNYDEAVKLGLVKAVEAPPAGGAAAVDGGRPEGAGDPHPQSSSPATASGASPKPQASS